MATLLLLLLALTPLPARAQDDPPDAIRRFLRAVLSADAAALDSTILPCPGSATLLQARPVEDAELAALEPRQETPLLLQGEPVEGPPPVGARAMWSAGFRGNLLAFPVELTPDGWRVDPRYMVASLEPDPPDGPEASIRKFVFHLLARDRVELAKVATSLPPLAGEPAFEDQYYELALEMPVAPARVGEVFRVPGGGVATAPPPTDDRAWYVGQYGLFEVPFEMVREGGAWKVVPRDYLSWLEGS